MLLATVVWDEVLGSTAAWVGWSVVLVGWVVGVVTGRRRQIEFARTTADAWRGDGVRGGAGDPSQSVTAAQDLFPEALNEYLQGNWLVAEEKCRELVRRRRDDVEARLLLATLLRSTERFEDARRALDDLEKFDGALRWEMEIACERSLLDEAEAESKNADYEDTESEETDSEETAVAGDESSVDEPTGAKDTGTEVTGTTESSGSNLPTRRAA